jgi:hypothetical protein
MPTETTTPSFNCDAFLGKFCKYKDSQAEACWLFLQSNVRRDYNGALFNEYIVLDHEGVVRDGRVFAVREIEEVKL